MRVAALPVQHADVDFATVAAQLKQDLVQARSSAAEHAAQLEAKYTDTLRALTAEVRSLRAAAAERAALASNTSTSTALESGSARHAGSPEKPGAAPGSTASEQAHVSRQLYEAACTSYDSAVDTLVRVVSDARALEQAWEAGIQAAQRDAMAAAVERAGLAEHDKQAGQAWGDAAAAPPNAAAVMQAVYDSALLTVTTAQTDADFAPAAGLAAGSAHSLGSPAASKRRTTTAVVPILCQDVQVKAWSIPHPAWASISPAQALAHVVKLQRLHAQLHVLLRGLHGAGAATAHAALTAHAAAQVRQVKLENEVASQAHIVQYLANSAHELRAQLRHAQGQAEYGVPHDSCASRPLSRASTPGPGPLQRSQSAAVAALVTPGGALPSPDGSLFRAESVRSRAATSYSSSAESDTEPAAPVRSRQQAAASERAPLHSSVSTVQPFRLDHAAAPAPALAPANMPALAPAPVLPAESDDVSAIVAHMQHHGRWLFRVRWRGADASADEWFYGDDLAHDVPGMLAAYKAAHGLA